MRKKVLSLFVCICIVLSSLLLCFSSGAAVINKEYTVALGENHLTALDGDASVTNLYSYTPDKVGVYKVTVEGENAVLSFWGSNKFFLTDSTETSSAIEYDKENNTYSIFVKDGFVGNYYLIGVTGAVEYTLFIEYLGEDQLPFDPSVLPWNIYEPTVELSPYVFDGANEWSSLTYVNIRRPHTAVLGDDGYYHLDKPDGEILFANICETAPYLSLYAATSYGAIRDYVYDEDGNYVDKYDFNDCIVQYYNNSDKDYDVYPLTYDLIYILQTHGNNKGWYDIDNNPGGYIFDTMVVDESSAWMYCVGYFSGYTIEDKTPRFNVSFGDSVMQYTVGETVTLSDKVFKYDMINDYASVFGEWIVSGVEDVTVNGAELQFVMPENDVTVEAARFLHGDLDNNGSVSVADVFKLMLAIKNGENSLIFDLNLDGKITIVDKLALLTVLKGEYDYSYLMSQYMTLAE